MDNTQNSSCCSTDYRNYLSLVTYDRETELEICNFYIKVLIKMQGLSRLQFTDIRQSLATIRSHKNPDLEKHDTISFNENADRLAYIFAYSSIHSCVMYNHLFDMLKGNATMFEKIISMKQLRVTLLGGGPSFEAVSMCKLLNEVLKKLGSLKREPLQIILTVIDMYEGWEEDLRLIFTLAQQELFSNDYVKIDVNFIKANLADDFNDDVRRSLKDSHIVTMFKFLSDVCDSSYEEPEVSDLIEKIIKSMSFKACLFFLDTSGGGIFKKINNMIDSSMETYRIYGPSCHNSHVLHTDNVEYIYRNLKQIFRYLTCTDKMKISCSAWLKVRANLKLDLLPSILPTVPVKKDFNDSKKEKSKVKCRPKFHNPKSFSL